jgi:hypothetical protein
VNTVARQPMKISLCFVGYVTDPTTLFAYSQKLRIYLSSGNAIFASNANNVAQINISTKTISKTGLI